MQKRRIKSWLRSLPILNHVNFVKTYQKLLEQQKKVNRPQGGRLIGEKNSLMIKNYSARAFI